MTLATRMSESLMPGKTAIGFDVTAVWNFTLQTVFPVERPSMTIFKLPAGYAGARVRWLTVNGEPGAIFYNNVTWILTLVRGGVQEYLNQSLEQGVANTINMSGLRWAVVGSLQEPNPVRINMQPKQELGLALIAHTAPNNTPITIYTRAMGEAFI